MDGTVTDGTVTDGTDVDGGRVAERRSTDHDVRHRYCEGVKLDLSNHVAHRTMPGVGGAEVPADPSIERHLFETRQPYNGFLIPGPRRRTRTRRCLLCVRLRRAVLAVLPRSV